MVVSKERMFLVKEVLLMLLAFGAIAALAYWVGESGEIKPGTSAYVERINVEIQNCVIDYVGRIPSELLPAPVRIRDYCSKSVIEAEKHDPYP